jgi:type IV pilus assembly protein PilB
MAQILKEHRTNKTKLSPSGSLTKADNGDEFIKFVTECIDKGDKYLNIDLDGVAQIDSDTLEFLLDTHDALIKQSGSLSIINANQLHTDIFRITGIKNRLHIESSLDNNLLRFPEEKRSGPKLFLGEMLVEAGLISKDKVEQALSLQSDTGQRMGQIMVDKGWISETDMLEVLSYQLQVPYIKLKQGLYDTSLTSLIDKNTAQRLKILPLFKIRKKMIIATSDPQAILNFDEIHQKTKLEVRPILVESREIQQYTDELYNGSTNLHETVSHLEDDFELVAQDNKDNHKTIDELAAGSPIINLVNAIIQRAIRDKGSDIHIEPSSSKSRVRLRIDGALYEIMSPAIEMHPAIVSRLKIMANLDISERRLPQDGRIQVSTSGRMVDLRFSSLPGIFGEKVVLRVLDKNQSILDIDKLGMSHAIKSSFKSLLGKSHGLILVTGPTGSGKTTSLYAAINYLNSSEKSIVTIEDPVEYQIDSINQNQIKDATGLSFAKLLKHVLRQDPDIVMVGEIRDKETAEIAIQSALTGHLVLSTLHTNNAIGAITRLLDMGIQPFLLSSALAGVVAQRLIRTVCNNCKTSYTVTSDVLKQYYMEDEKRIRFSKGRGCPTCYDSGFKGRIGIHEIIAPDSNLQKLMISNPTREQLEDYIEKQGIQTLFDDGLDRVKQGLSTIEEIERVANMEG